MKIEVLSVLLFIAVASSLSDDPNEEKQDGMCPRDFFKKYPEKFKMMKDKKHMPDFTKMTDCAATGVCEDNLKCCQTPCGMRCMKPLFENSDPFEDARNNNEEPSDSEEESNSESDEKLGMCPHNYLKRNPDFKKKLHERFRSRNHYPTDTLCNEGQEGPGCLKENSQNREHGKPPMKFPNFTRMADCTADGDCANNMRCCRSPCGKKCMKGIFSEEDFEKQIEEHMENKREKRDLSENNEENNGEEQEGEREHKKGHGKEEGHENDHGKGKGHGKGHKHGKGDGKRNGEGGEHGKGHGKRHGEGGEHGEGHGKRHGEGGKHGEGHGKRHGEGGEHGEGHGKRHGKGGDHGKSHGNGEGGEHGKGHLKRGKHGKEHRKGEGNEMGQGKEPELEKVSEVAVNGQGELKMDGPQVRQKRSFSGEGGEGGGKGKEGKGRKKKEKSKKKGNKKGKGKHQSESQSLP
ncbi:uncharacterized protein O3C94_017886 [Discoglossus pictus]